MAIQYAKPDGGPETIPIASDSFNRDTTANGVGTTDGAVHPLDSRTSGAGQTWAITTTGKTARIDGNKCKSVGNVLASDSFDRADSTNLGNTDGNWPSAGSGGDGLAWFELDSGGGNIEIDGNMMRADESAGYSYASVETGSSDIYMESNWISNDTSVEFALVVVGIARTVDPVPLTKSWRVWGSNYSSGWLALTEITSGAGVSRGAIYDSDVWNSGGGQNNKIRVLKRGDTLSIWCNDVGPHSYQNATVDDGNTNHGLMPTQVADDSGVDNVIIWSADIPIVSDSVDRADSASLGNTDGDWPYADAGGDGVAWAQTSDAGGHAFEIVSNRIVDDTGSYGYIFGYLDAGEEDVKVECNVTDSQPGSRPPGWTYGFMVLRYIDIDNQWLFGHYYDNSTMYLWDIRGGVWVNRGGSSGPGWVVDGSDNRMVASCVGAELSCTTTNSSGQTTLSYTDLTAAAKATKHGVATYNNFNRIENIAIFPYSSRATGVIDTSEDTSTTSGELCRMDINYGATDGSPDDLLYVATLNYSSEYQCFRIALNDNATGPLSIYEVDGNIASTYLRASDTTGYTWHKDGTINKVQCGVQKYAIWAKVGESFVWYYNSGVDDGYTKHGWIISDDNVYVDSIAMYPLTQWTPLGYIAASPGVDPATPLSIPVASDSFERANSASLGTTDGAATAVSGGSGLTWTQFEHAGASPLEISSNTVTASAAVDQYKFAAVHLATGVKDVVVEVNATETDATDGAAFIVGRYISDDNYWVAMAFSTWGGAVYLYQWNGTSWISRGQTNSTDCWLAPGTNRLVAVIAGDLMGVGTPDTTGAWIWNTLPDSTDYSYALSVAAGFGCGLYYDTTAINNFVCWPAEYYPQLVDDSDDTFLYTNNNPIGLFVIDDMPLRLKLDDSVVDPEEASSLILASDTFDRADSPMPADLGETDGNWPSTDTGGAGLPWIAKSTDPENGRDSLIVLKDNTLQLTAGSYNSYEHAIVDTGESDVVVETNQGSLVQTVVGVYGCIILRYVDDDNFWIMMLWPYSVQYGFIYEKTAGVWYTRNTTNYMGWDGTGFNKLQGKVAGLNISFGIVGEAAQATYTMPSPIHATGTKHGVTIYTSSTWMQVQNIAIWKAVSTHKVVVRAASISGAAAHSPTMKAQLMQGNTSIASETFSYLTASPEDYTMTLTGMEVNNITDYDDLYLILTADGSNGVDQQLYGAHFQVGDDAPAGGGGAQTRFMLLGVG